MDISELIKLGRLGVNLPPGRLTQLLSEQRSNEPNKKPAPPDTCPTCGMPADTPGWLRPAYSQQMDMDELIPCPDCNERKLTDRARLKTQLEGWLQKATFANYGITGENRRAYEAAREFADNPRGFLTLWGGYGPGKTHLLAAITNALEGRGRYYTFPDLVSQYREAVGFGAVEAFYARIAKVEVLIVDEVDKASLKDWTREQAYRLFDCRYRNWEICGTVLALNESPHLFNESLGYLFSRMKDERFKCIEVGGGDNRPNVGLMDELANIQQT